MTYIKAGESCCFIKKPGVTVFFVLREFLEMNPVFLSIEGYSLPTFSWSTLLNAVTKTGSLLTWQLGDLRSHSRIVLSREPDITVSSIGDIHKDTTLQNRTVETTFGYYSISQMSALFIAFHGDSSTKHPETITTTFIECKISSAAFNMYTVINWQQFGPFLWSVQD